MTNKPVRVRFAPSPTGGLHIGGVRTVLYNYLFARQHQGTFVLRVEDTDQSRFVPGAEEYIFRCLAWCGLEPDESVLKPGNFGPYRQSERKENYRQYAEQLIANGHAYYAFDTPEELTAMRENLKTDSNPSPQYSQATRGRMRNSLSLTAAETQQLLAADTPHVIRIKMPENETISFTDMIRGEVSFDTGLSDDKVLLKADGMPTYHLAVVVDDYLMQITHAFRGEEWLPSAPVHLLLWKYLGWQADMPQWAHLPLIVGPDGAKLSKRHGSKYGFPIFAMNWTNPVGELNEGFRERGFLPEALINLLVMLGWNDGSGQEIFSLDEMVQAFDLSRVSHSPAAFDYEKAKWYNHQYIQKADNARLADLLAPILAEKNITADSGYVAKAIGLAKERCQLVPELWEQTAFFFERPQHADPALLQDKWHDGKKAFFQKLAEDFATLESWDVAKIEETFGSVVTAVGVKKGEVMLPFRIMLVGGKFGPGVMEIAEMIGREETVARVLAGLAGI